MNVESVTAIWKRVTSFFVCGIFQWLSLSFQSVCALISAAAHDDKVQFKKPAANPFWSLECNCIRVGAERMLQLHFGFIS